MSTGPKPGTLKSGTFDAFRLARERETLRGQFDAAASERLFDWLMEGEAPISWSIAGTTDALGRLALAIEVKGSVPMECQRCLQPMAWAVLQRTLALLAASEADGDALMPAATRKCSLRRRRSMRWHWSKTNCCYRCRIPPYMRTGNAQHRISVHRWSLPPVRIRHVKGEPHGCAAEQEVAVEARHASRA